MSGLYYRARGKEHIMRKIIDIIVNDYEHIHNNYGAVELKRLQVNMSLGLLAFASWAAAIYTNINL
jgi:hypothetical protein